MTDLTRRLQSFYVPMRDGVRLAVDLWLPVAEIERGKQVGTVLRATRYHRARAMPDATPETDSNAAEAALWGGAGLALVVVDARGSGASFGTRAAELAPREIADYGEVIDWIAAQPWSNDRVGAYGYSYDGDTAELMAGLGNPHLVAVAPLFSDFDVYRQLVYPGGCYTEGAFGARIGFTQVLDGADADPAVKPVDGPDGPALLEQALHEHRANVDLAAVVPRAECRDDREGAVDWDTLSPAHRQAAIEASGVAMLVRAGWLDAGCAAGALTRFASFGNAQQVEIGPWAHGGDTLADPLRTSGIPEDPRLTLEAQNERLVEFFNHHLRGGDRPAARRELHLCALGTHEWRTLTTWPPPGTRAERWWPAGARRRGRDAHHPAR